MALLYFWHGYWRKESNLIEIDMKKNLKTTTLILGIIVAIIAFSNSQSYAEATERIVPLMSLPHIEINSVPIEIKLISDSHKEIEENLIIYSKDYELVYEGKKDIDLELKKLVHKSDLIMYSNSTAYYILSE